MNSETRPIFLQGYLLPDGTLIPPGKHPVGNGFCSLSKRVAATEAQLALSLLVVNTSFGLSTAWLCGGKAQMTEPVIVNAYFLEAGKGT